MKKLKLAGRRLEDILKSLPTKSEARPILPNGFEKCLRMRIAADACDTGFDSVLPMRYRALSTFHWTSVKVVYKISEFLGDCGQAKFIDIGSGVAKVCVALSFLTDWEIFGLEQRTRLHEIGKSIVDENEIKRVHLINGNLIDLDWEGYDIFYFYNPFSEHTMPTNPLLIDSSIELNPIFFKTYVDHVETRLKHLRAGTKLITFHGFGGVIPDGWKVLFDTEIDSGSLTIHEKQ